MTRMNKMPSAYISKVPILKVGCSCSGKCKIKKNIFDLLATKASSKLSICHRESIQETLTQFATLNYLPRQQRQIVSTCKDEAFYNEKKECVNVRNNVSSK